METIGLNNVELKNFLMLQGYRILNLHKKLINNNRWYSFFFFKAI